MSIATLYSLLPLLVLSLGLSLLLTPLMRLLAHRCGLVDRPDGRRKLHGRCVPVAGGLAVLASSLAALLAAGASSWPAGAYLRAAPPSLLGLLCGALVLCGVGVADDLGRLRVRYKLVGQLVAVALVLTFGVQVKAIVLFGVRLELGPLAVPFTAFWLLGAINSLNLIDGMDGLLGSIGVIVCLAIAALAALHGNHAPACVAVALAGALLGFLRYNLPPASIFLGDAGSMLIGLVVGVLAIQSSLKSSATVALAAPAALLVVPIFDTAAAIVRRKLTGRSIYSTDRGHLHHVMLSTGLSRPGVLMIVSGLCLLTVVGVMASQALQNEALALLSAFVVVAVLVLSRLFGHAEVVLVLKRFGGLARSVTGNHQVLVRLQGSLDWQEVWARLTEQGERLNLTEVRLDVNAPAIHEGYHALWFAPDRAESEGQLQAWHTELPLTACGQEVGRLKLVGCRDEQPVWAKVAAMAGVVDQIEARLAELTNARRAAAAASAAPPLPTPQAGLAAAPAAVNVAS
jgi:UDP-GlcNAc:undecaprenyl-phosphate GlcNAc-1-phosphate transferase